MLVRTPHRKTPYLILDRHPIDNPNLSLGALGLHVFLMAHPDNWRVNVKYIYENKPEGRDKIRNYLLELRAHGYAALLRYTRNGKLIAWETTVYETPDRNPYYDSAMPPELRRRHIISVESDDEQAAELAAYATPDDDDGEEEPRTPKPTKPATPDPDFQDLAEKPDPAFQDLAPDPDFQDLAEKPDPAIQDLAPHPAYQDLEKPDPDFQDLVINNKYNYTHTPNAHARTRGKPQPNADFEKPTPHTTPAWPKRKAAQQLASKSPYLRDAKWNQAGYVEAGSATNVVQVYYEFFLIASAEDRLTDPLEEDFFRSATPYGLNAVRSMMQAYARSGYRKRNVQLMLDWLADPNRQPSNQKRGSTATDSGRAFNRSTQNATPSPSSDLGPEPDDYAAIREQVRAENRLRAQQERERRQQAGGS